MKTKIIFIIISIAIVSAGIVSMVFLVEKGEPEEKVAAEEKSETPAKEPEKEVSQATLLDTDYFTITLPSSWEGTSKENTLPIMIADSQEQILGEKAKEIGFGTNLSINRAELGDGLFEDYVKNLKASLINNIPLIEITKEEKTAINGSDAYFLEIESIQQDLKFNTLVALVVNEANIVWAFSFNTLKESWPDYKDIFYQMVNSIKMK